VKSSCLFSAISLPIGLWSHWLREWISAHKVSEVGFGLVVAEVLGVEELPWLPVLHNSQKFDFIVSLKNEFLNKPVRDLVLNSSDGLSLVNDFHSISCEFLTQDLVSINVRKILQLLESQIIKLHQLHSWEWFDIQESDTS